MTGLPNLTARLEYIESRVWTAADKASYLATIPDPDAALTLRVEMLAVYVQGNATPLASTALTVNTDGSISVPLLYRATSTEPWQRVERIEIVLTPEMFDGFVLDTAPTALPVGTTAAWSELRPNVFTLVPDVPPQTKTNVFVPLVQK